MKRKEEGSKEMVPMGMDLWPPEIPRNESSFSMSCPATTSPHQKEINTLSLKYNSAAISGRRITVDGIIIKPHFTDGESEAQRGTMTDHSHKANSGGANQCLGSPT